ncbi:MAG: leucine-rich repeat domain-containing protein [Prevotella sp.]|nr:leucine-rich repeat domain-containing protein [Prevotella sp.]
MKHHNVKLMLPMLLCFASLCVSAHDFEVDGIYYNITSTEDLSVKVTYDGGFADSGTSYSGNVTIPKSVKYEGETYRVTSIGYKAFSKCSQLISVSIPESITNIGDSAFYQCGGLQKVIVPNLAAWCTISFVNQYSNPLYYAKHFYSDANTEIRDLIIPEGVRKIGNYAFENGLFQTVTIPGSVEDVWI